MAAKKDVKVIMFCDFGEPGRQDALARHYSFKTAANQYKRLWGIYHRIHGWKVWQEEVKP